MVVRRAAPAHQALARTQVGRPGMDRAAAARRRQKLGPGSRNSAGPTADPARPDFPRFLDLARWSHARSDSPRQAQPAALPPALAWRGLILAASSRILWPS